MYVLLDVQAWENEFDVQAESVGRIEAEVCSQTDIVVICVSCTLKILVYIVAGSLYITLEAAADHIIFITCVVAEAV